MNFLYLTEVCFNNEGETAELPTLVSIPHIYRVEGGILRGEHSVSRVHVSTADRDFYIDVKDNIHKIHEALKRQAS